MKTQKATRFLEWLDVHAQLARKSVKNFGNGASADGAATFTDGELGSLFHGDGVDEVDGEGDVVTRHNHIGAGREFDASGDVGRTEEELRTIAVKEVGVTAAFLFGEDVGRRGELVVRDDGARFGKDLATFDLLTGDTTEKRADVVAALGEVQGLAEHFKTGNDGALGRFDTDDFSRVVDVDAATFDTAGNNGATARDGHDVFDREKEGLGIIVDRIRDVGVKGVEKLKDGLAGGIVDGLGVAGLESGATDNRGFVAREVVFVEKVANVHFNEVDEFGVIDLVALVEEDDDVRNADLTGKKDVFLGLRHNAIGSRNDEDSSIHLGGAGDHVLDVVSVPRAVDVRIVTLLGFVFDVGRVDRDTTSALFRSGVDVGVRHVFGESFERKDVGDGRGKGGLTVVDVADGTNVEVDAVTVEFFFCHLNFLQ